MAVHVPQGTAADPYAPPAEGSAPPPMAVHVPKADSQTLDSFDSPPGAREPLPDDLPSLKDGQEGREGRGKGEASGGRFSRTREPQAPETIGIVALVVRAIGSILCLAIAVLMISNGHGLMSLWPYIITMAYAGAAIWGLTSVRQKITVQQFAIEMAILVAVTLVLRTASPEMFAVEAQQEIQGKVAAEPKLPNTPLGRFTGMSLEVLNGTLTLVDSTASTPEEWKGRVKAIDYAGLAQIHATLSSDDKLRVNGIWKHVSLFAPKVLEEALASKRQDEQGRYCMLPSSEVLTGRKKLTDALRRAELLRSTVLVWPDEEVED
jgi:hypothetical protein